MQLIKIQKFLKLQEIYCLSYSNPISNIYLQVMYCPLKQISQEIACPAEMLLADSVVNLFNVYDLKI